MPATCFSVIIAGGKGTRFWPLSRTRRPKQLLKIIGPKSLIAATADRVDPLSGSVRTLIVTIADQLAAMRRELKNLPKANFIAEPQGRNTAPCIGLAAMEVVRRDPEAIMVVLPADHWVRDAAGFRKALNSAVRLAQRLDRLITIGIRPEYPETGYGYIERGEPMAGLAGCFKVARFVEKPDLASAKKFLASGRFYWNSGMFVFRASRYLDELGKHRPDILQAARNAWEKNARDLDFIRLDEQAFLASPSESIDYAVMEKTRDAVVVEADIQWSDIGSWTALWQAGTAGPDGNVTVGDVHADTTRNCYIRAESRLVAAVGVEDLVIVETADAVLVTHKSCSQDVKRTVEALKAKQRDEYLIHKRVYRPWGYYEGLDSSARFQVKRIMVKPGSKLSLQMHHHRAEHWVVVSGTAKVTRGDETILLTENESTYIPLGTKHRLENVGKLPLFMIEVQSGSYLGEDDIVRFDDDYKRT